MIRYCRNCRVVPIPSGSKRRYCGPCGILRARELSSGSYRRRHGLEGLPARRFNYEEYEDETYREWRTLETIRKVWGGPPGNIQSSLSEEMLLRPQFGLRDLVHQEFRRAKHADAFC